MFEVGKFYESEDWTIGGTNTYECIKREGEYAQFEASWSNCDGEFKQATPMLKIRKTLSIDDGEYVVLGTYLGHEHRLYARRQNE